MLGTAVFVAFHIERLYETREIETILARSVSRETFVLSYWLGIVCVVSIIVIPVLAGANILSNQAVGTIWWSASLALELLIVVAFVLFAGLTMERALPTIFSTVGFYALARLMSFFTAIASGGPQTETMQAVGPIAKGLSYVVPRLDLFAQTRWLIYGSDGASFWPVAVQALIFAPLLICAAMFDLRKKQF